MTVLFVNTTDATRNFQKQFEVDSLPGLHNLVISEISRLNDISGIETDLVVNEKPFEEQPAIVQIIADKAAADANALANNIKIP